MYRINTIYHFIDYELTLHNIYVFICIVLNLLFYIEQVIKLLYHLLYLTIHLHGVYLGYNLFIPIVLICLYYVYN